MTWGVQEGPPLIASKNWDPHPAAAEDESCRQPEALEEDGLMQATPDPQELRP